MRYLLFLIPSVFSLSGFTQSYNKGLVTDKVTVNAPDQTITAYIHPVKKEIEANPKRNYYWYSANQINQTQGGFSGKLLNGAYTVFYSNKNLKEQGEFKNGLKQGEWRSWYDNGQLKDIVKWKSGNRKGVFKEYNTGGNIQRSGQYKDGDLQGKIITYSGRDSTNTVEYKEGLPVIKPEKKTSSEPKKNKLKSTFSRIFKKKEKAKSSSDPKKKKEKNAKSKASPQADVPKK